MFYKLINLLYYFFLIGCNIIGCAHLIFQLLIVTICEHVLLVKQFQLISRINFFVDFYKFTILTPFCYSEYP